MTGSKRATTVGVSTGNEGEEKVNAKEASFFIQLVAIRNHRQECVLTKISEAPPNEHYDRASRIITILGYVGGPQVLSTWYTEE